MERDDDIELRLLLEAIRAKYQHDFRHYSPVSLKRRLGQAVAHFGTKTLSGLQERILHEPALFPEMLGFLTIQVSDMFRDPSFFRSVRQHVVPALHTYPSLKVWIPGCSTGEEVYSLAIVLREEGLLDRTLIYATDINAAALAAAEKGVYRVERMPAFSKAYQAGGGKASLADYYTVGYGLAMFDKTLRRDIVFSDHSLATDHVFAEVELVSCRNVLLYFDRELQDRALGLCRESLSRRGFLGLGAKESLRFSAHADAFVEVVPGQRIYQKR